MKNLLYKEFRLALHPAPLMFLCLSAMMMIPNYPLFVTFFYTCLGIFFICLIGRENKDIYYSMLLPVCKSALVKARFMLIILLETAQILLAMLFAALRCTVIAEPNAVGMNANTAFFGFAMALLGLFNFFFFRAYYKNTDQVGKPFLYGCIAFTLVMLAVEACSHVVPFVRDFLNAAAGEYLLYKLVVFIAGVLSYILLTFAAYKSSVKAFNKLDI